jgi:hypothetical protein
MLYRDILNAIRGANRNLKYGTEPYLGESPPQGSKSVTRSPAGSPLFPTSTLFGMKVITSPYIPNDVPCIQVRHLTLKDGTPLLSGDFLARENAWWLKEFGTKQVAFILNDQQMIAVGTAMRERIDREIERTLGGLGLRRGNSL